MLEIPDAKPIAKKAKSNDTISVAPRATKGGQSLPRKTTIQPHALIPAPTPQKATARSKKKGRGTRATKAPPTPKGKYKSAETIENSDEDYGLNDDDDDQGGADEFANLLGECLADKLSGTDGDGEEDDEEDEEEDEEEEEGNELEGARLMVRDELRGGSSEFG